MMASVASPYLEWGLLRPCLACCERIWVSELAIFGPCVAIVAYIPTVISLLVLVLRYSLRPFWRRRPIWLRNFAADDLQNFEHTSGEIDAAPKSRTWTLPIVFLLINSVFGIVISTLAAIYPRNGPLFLTPLFPHVVTVIILVIERPRSTPGSPLVLQGTLFLTQLVLFSTILHFGTTQGLLVWTVEVVTPLISAVVIVNMPIRDPFSDQRDICRPFQQPTSILRSPEDNFTLWNWMSANWMSPIVKAGCQRQLDDEDIWNLPLDYQHDRLHRLFRDVKGSVLTRLLKTNAPDLILTTCLGILESLCTLLPIVLLKQLLGSLEIDQPDRKVAMVYGVFILLVRLIGAQSGIFNLWFCRRAYERSRGEMITMIYEKTLMRKAFTFPSEQHSDEKTDQVKTATSGPAPLGKVLNLMRNDVYEVAQRFWEFANLFTKPMTFILTIVLIWKILDLAALAGVLLIVFAQILNAFIIRSLISWERARRAVTDVKLQITSQFVEAIRHLRWYDWQDKWLGQILASRQKELRYRVIVNLISKLIAATNKISAYFFPVAAFYAYTIIGKQPLRIDIAFPALTLFTQLNSSLNELPGLITVLLNANVAMNRIESFMAEPNKEDMQDAGSYSDTEAYPTGGAEPRGKLEMTFLNASFTWPGSPSDKRVLSNVSFEAAPGLTAVCGKVGSGKTALLHAILGELDEQGGVRQVPNEKMGYCAQTPWLQSMSIRENILFSSGFDEPRYRQVLAACCLIPDLANWRAGDLAMIGENGVGLSGGQKARVALARAVYSETRVLLLDDPIAALDHQTAETILRNLFTNTDLMQGRIVVFVSHRMDILTRYAEQVLEITQAGTVTVISRNEIDAHEELLHFTAHRDEHKREAMDEDQRDIDEDVVADKFIEDEFRAHGGVMKSVYWKYIKAGNLWYWAILVVLFSMFRAARLSHFYFLKIWGESYQNASTQVYLMANDPSQYHHHATSSSLDSSTVISKDWWKIDLDLPPPDTDARPWLFWFFIIALIQFTAFVLSDLMIVLLIYTAGRHLFQQVMHKVANATFRFYDVTPVGRLMNRLTSDIGTIDGQIVTQIRDVAWYFMFWASSLFVIASTTPMFLVIAAVMTTIFVLVFLRFLPASQSLRRLEMVSLSPLMSNFGTLLEGLTTVRAFRAQPHFQDRIIVTTDAFQKMDHFFWSLQAWLMFRFDTLSAFSTFILTISALLTGLSAGTVGFVLATAANFVTCTHALCRKYGELQMQFVSVERVIELMDLEEEPKGDLEPPAAWPSYDDDISFDNVTVRYAKGLDPSLRDLSFRIPAGATVAVTGRTGSGKSTLALTLLGTILPEVDEVTGTLGSIHIGSVDVARVNKHALRQRISFVAQDPVLFPGTLRDNIDPMGEHSDEECALVLRRVLGAGDEVDDLFASGSASPARGGSGSSSGAVSEMSSTSGSTVGAESDHEDGDEALLNSNNTAAENASPKNEPATKDHSSTLSLSTRVDGGGKNLSQGQRQLIGLGRAVLRRSPIVILDEATASIDKKTAFYIQQVLREELRQSTVITIAHRVEAVKDADFEIVLDKGRVVRAQALIGG